MALSYIPSGSWSKYFGFETAPSPKNKEETFDKYEVTFQPGTADITGNRFWELNDDQYVGTLTRIFINVFGFLRVNAIKGEKVEHNAQHILRQREELLNLVNAGLFYDRAVIEAVLHHAVEWETNIRVDSDKVTYIQVMFILEHLTSLGIQVMSTTDQEELDELLENEHPFVAAMMHHYYDSAGDPTLEIQHLQLARTGDDDRANDLFQELKGHYLSSSKTETIISGSILSNIESDSKISSGKWSVHLKSDSRRSVVAIIKQTNTNGVNFQLIRSTGNKNVEIFNTSEASSVIDEIKLHYPSASFVGLHSHEEFVDTTDDIKDITFTPPHPPLTTDEYWNSPYGKMLVPVVDYLISLVVPPKSEKMNTITEEADENQADIDKRIEIMEEIANAVQMSVSVGTATELAKEFSNIHSGIAVDARVKIDAGIQTYMQMIAIFRLVHRQLLEFHTSKLLATPDEEVETGNLPPIVSYFVEEMTSDGWKRFIDTHSFRFLPLLKELARAVKPPVHSSKPSRRDTFDPQQRLEMTMLQEMEGCRNQCWVVTFRTNKAALPEAVMIEKISTRKNPYHIICSQGMSFTKTEHVSPQLCLDKIRLEYGLRTEWISFDAYLGRENGIIAACSGAFDASALFFARILLSPIAVYKTLFAPKPPQLPPKDDFSKMLHAPLPPRTPALPDKVVNYLHSRATQEKDTLPAFCLQQTLFFKGAIQTDNRVPIKLPENPATIMEAAAAILGYSTKAGDMSTFYRSVDTYMSAAQTSVHDPHSVGNIHLLGAFSSTRPNAPLSDCIQRVNSSNLKNISDPSKASQKERLASGDPATANIVDILLMTKKLLEVTYDTYRGRADVALDSAFMAFKVTPLARRIESSTQGAHPSSLEQIFTDEDDICIQEVPKWIREIDKTVMDILQTSSAFQTEEVIVSPRIEAIETSLSFTGLIEHIRKSTAPKTWVVTFREMHRFTAEIDVLECLANPSHSGPAVRPRKEYTVMIRRRSGDYKLEMYTHQLGGIASLREETKSTQPKTDIEPEDIEGFLIALYGEQIVPVSVLEMSESEHCLEKSDSPLSRDITDDTSSISSDDRSPGKKKGMGKGAFPSSSRTSYSAERIDSHDSSASSSYYEESNDNAD